MTQTRRERLRETTFAEIKSVARQQMAEQGTASISLRAIASQMGMAAPSLYNYFKSRDDLITALLIEAFNSLADVLEAASLAITTKTGGEKLFAAYLAYRDWALRNSTDFSLITGSPIPGYHAPENITTPAAKRIMSLFQELWQEACSHNQFTIPAEYAEIPDGLRQQLEAWEELEGNDLPPAVLHLLLTSWAKAQGMVSLELYGQLRYTLKDPFEFYQFEIRSLLRRIGLSIPE
jgi:AcrR family transcriptional regulator